MKSTTKHILFSSRRMLPALLAVIVMLFAIAGASAAQTEVNLYNFSYGANPNSPQSGVIRDSDGNLYGVTFFGGHVSHRCELGCGVVFKLSPDGTFTVLHTFKALNDGTNPYGTLFRDERGNLYGTTIGGGAYGNGTIFRISASGGERVLYSFTGVADGSRPYSGLVYSHGNLYGTTYQGGAAGHGTVYELTSSGALIVLHTFAGEPDGDTPLGGLVRDANGNLFGTTYFGGAFGFGTVYKVDATGTESVLYSFAGGTDGANSSSDLLVGNGGELFGTTSEGGTNNDCTNCGTIFRLDPTGTETVLLRFTGGSNGSNPRSGLVRDAKGNFYGTTAAGGDSSVCGYGCGTIFELTVGGKFKPLYSFGGRANNDGQNPIADMILDGEGNLFGMVQAGGSIGAGTIFEFTP
jgi:uncharacterized repeat protein (TIGR03803 family)